MTTTSTRAPVISTAFILAWFGANLSVTGDEILNFALLVNAAHGTGSVGILGFLVGLPALFGAWIGAWIAKRKERANHILVGSAVLGAVVVGVLWLLWTGTYLVLVTYAAVFMLGILKLTTWTTWQSSVPDLANTDNPDEIRRLMGWTVTSFGVGAALGPFIAGSLASMLDRRSLVLVDGITFVLAALLVLPAARRLFRNSGPRDTVRAAAGDDGRDRARWWEGVRLIFRQPLVRTPTLCLAATNFVTFGVLFSIPLVLLEKGMSDRMIGWVWSTFMAGSLVGSAASTRFRNDRMFRVYLVGEPAVRALGLVALAIATTPIGVLAGAALFTIPQGMGRVARESNMATTFEGAQRFRVLGAYQTIIRGAMPLAPLVMGTVVLDLGSTTFLLGAAVLLTGFSVAVSSDRSLRSAMLARTAANAIR